MTQGRYTPDRRFQPSIGTEFDYTSENLEKLWVYWRSKLKGREMPARGDLDPAELPELLPYVALIEVRWEPRCFFCGLVAYWHISHQRAWLRHDRVLLRREIFRPSPDRSNGGV